MRGAPRPTEKEIQRQCLDWLALWGAFPVRVNSGAFTGVGPTGRKRFVRCNSQPGCSDCLCVLPDGRFGAVEFKRPGGKPTELQASFLAAVRERGGVGLVVSSLDDLWAQLRYEGYEL